MGFMMDEDMMRWMCGNNKLFEELQFAVVGISAAMNNQYTCDASLGPLEYPLR